MFKPTPLDLPAMLILDNFLCWNKLTYLLTELNSHIWPFRLTITFGWLQKLNPGYEICIISNQVNLSSEVSDMFNILMPSLNIRSLPFVVFLGGFPSRCQNLSSGAQAGRPLVISSASQKAAELFYWSVVNFSIQSLISQNCLISFLWIGANNGQIRLPIG